MKQTYYPWNVVKFFGIILVSTLTSGDNLALLTGTLRTFHKLTCDEDWMTLRCPTGTTISVSLAHYGRNSSALPSKCAPAGSLSRSEDFQFIESASNWSCAWPVAIQTVVVLCQKKTSCKFQTTPRTFGGDPCPGTRKFVEVAFKCRPSEFKSIIGCEDEVIQLKCNRSSRLAIYSASYGRTEYESIQCPQPNGVSEENCLSSFATQAVMQMCHGKRTCALKGDPITFGTPCKAESRKYLKVVYTCVPRKVLEEKYQGDLEPDETFEVEEAEEENGDTGVVEQPSIYSPDHHSRPWPHPKNVTGTGQSSLNQISDNRERVFVYAVIIGLISVIIILLLVISVKINILRRRNSPNNPEGTNLVTGSSSSNCVNISGSTSSCGETPIISSVGVPSVLSAHLIREGGLSFVESSRNNTPSKSATLNSTRSSSSAIITNSASPIRPTNNGDNSKIVFTELHSILKRTSAYDRQHAVRPGRVGAGAGGSSLAVSGGGGGGGGGRSSRSISASQDSVFRSCEVVRFSEPPMVVTCCDELGVGGGGGGGGSQELNHSEFFYG